MAEPTYISSGTYFDGASTSPAFAVPAGTSAGRVVLIPIFIDGNPLPSNPTPPAGFALAPGMPVQIPATSGSHSLYLYWKRLTGSDAGTYAFTLPASRYLEAQAHLYDNVVASGTPFDPSPGAAFETTNSTTTPVVSCTSAGPDRRLIHTATNWAGGTWTAGTGHTKRMQGGAGVITLTDRSWPTAGPTGNVTATCTGSDKRNAWLGALIGTTPDAVAVEGELDAALPALDGQASGTVTARGSLAAALPPLGGTLTGDATVTGTTNALLPALTGQLTATAGIPAAAELRDTFAAADLDTGRWAATNNTGVTGQQADGVYQFDVAADAVAFSQLASASVYDLTGSHYTAELVSAGSQAAGLEAYLVAEADASNRLVAVVAGGFLGIYKTVAGVQTGITFPAYSPTDHRWLRIREDEGVTYWEASPDGAAWTELHSEPTPITVTSTRLILQAGAWQAVGADTSVIWDNVGGATMAVLDAQLPALTGTLTATARTEAVLDAALPPLAAGLAATVRVAGGLSAQLPALTAGLDGAVTATGQLDGHLPALTGSLAAAAITRAALDGTLPALTGALQGTVETAGGHLAAVLPPLAGTLTGSARVAGSATAALPALGAALQGQARAVGALAATLPALGASVQGEVILPAGSLAGRLPALAASFSGTSAGVAPPDPVVRPGLPRLGWPVGGVSVRPGQASPPRPRWRVGVPLLGGDE